ncbi:hypothetical protein FGRMN_8176 [Fusarium graminum]|nr:hypothetical protein FGRMN_8176 [Fusarium graminum]
MQEIRENLLKINNDFPHLVDLLKALEELDKSVALVQQEEALQTATTVRRMKVINKRTQYIAGESVRMAKLQQRIVERNGPEASISSKHKYTFRPMPRWLSGYKDDLDQHILCAQVGLVGSIESGISIKSGILFETSAKVKEVLGTDLVLATRLRDTSSPVDGVNETIECFQKEETERKDSGVSHDETPDDKEQDRVYDNVTIDFARAIAGDVGEQAWTEAAKVPPSRRSRGAK